MFVDLLGCVNYVITSDCLHRPYTTTNTLSIDEWQRETEEQMIPPLRQPNSKLRNHLIGFVPLIKIIFLMSLPVIDLAHSIQTVLSFTFEDIRRNGIKQAHNVCID